MTKPTIKISIAFQDNPLATPTWTDVTADWRGEIGIRCGRATERDRIESGTASLTLDNRTRKYDPNNASSVYYPYVIPLRPIKIEATFNSITYPLYRGFIGGWTPIEPEGRDALVRLSCADAFEFFASVDSVALGSRPVENTASRVYAVLLALGWPSSDTVLYTGQTSLPISSGSVTPLSYMQDVALTENGLLFMDPSGRVVFQDRHFRLKNATALASFGNNGGSTLPFVAVTITNDKTQIFNDVQISYDGGTVTSSDTASQTRYFRRTLRRTILIGSVTEAQSCADWLRWRFSTAVSRIDSMAVCGHLSDSVWPHQLGRSISDPVAITYQPPGGGSPISGTYYIESIEHRIADQCATFDTTWKLSSVAGTSFLVFDNPNLGFGSAFVY